MKVFLKNTTVFFYFIVMKCIGIVIKCNILLKLIMQFQYVELLEYRAMF